jgi:glycosyltransferase involved in cell wall biosynthesis
MSKIISIREAMPHHVTHPRVSVIIPALNEARNLPHVAARMPIDVDEIVFVNGNSQDDTAEVARELWPDAVHVRQTRKGKGNALSCGFAAASGDIIVMIDADGSTDPAEIPRFVGALVSGSDFAKGSRFIQGGGSADITKIRRVGNWGLNTLVNILFATKYTDLCYGYNAFWSRCLEHISMPDNDAVEPQWGDGFEVETLINVRVAVNGLKIAEVCSFESDRIHGVSNLNAVSDGFRVLRTIRREFGRAKFGAKRPAVAAVEVATVSDIHEISDVRDEQSIAGTAKLSERRNRRLNRMRRSNRITVADNVIHRMDESMAEGQAL